MRSGSHLYHNRSGMASREGFVAWTESEAFKKANAPARAPEGTFVAHPNLGRYVTVR